MATDGRVAAVDVQLHACERPIAHFGGRWAFSRLMRPSGASIGFRMTSPSARSTRTGSASRRSSRRRWRACLDRSRWAECRGSAAEGLLPREAQKRSEALRSTQKRSDALRSTQKLPRMALLRVPLSAAGCRRLSLMAGGRQEALLRARVVHVRGEGSRAQRCPRSSAPPLADLPLSPRALAPGPTSRRSSVRHPSLPTTGCAPGSTRSASSRAGASARCSPHTSSRVAPTRT